MVTDPLGIILFIKGDITSFYSLKGGKAKILFKGKSEAVLREQIV